MFFFFKMNYSARFMQLCSIVIQLFKCFQRLGICKGSKGAKASVDKLCGEFDVEIKTWKKELEVNTMKLENCNFYVQQNLCGICRIRQFSFTRYLHMKKHSI